MGHSHTRVGVLTWREHMFREVEQGDAAIVGTVTDRMELSCRLWPNPMEESPASW